MKEFQMVQNMEINVNIDIGNQYSEGTLQCKLLCQTDEKSVFW